jgi:AraC-like DNA-binding protein
VWNDFPFANAEFARSQYLREEVMPEGRQRVGALIALPGILRELGANPAEIVAGAGIDPALLQNPENSLSFIEVGRLLRACVAATGCEYFGLLVGQRSGISSLGLVGRLMQTASTLRDALLDLCTNQRRYVRGSVIYLLVRDHIAFLGYAVHHPGVAAVEQITDAATAIGYNILRDLVGTSPDEVHCARRAPRNTAPYRSFFGSVPRFDAEQSGLVIPVALLGRPLGSADPQLRQTLRKAVAEYWAIEQPSVTHTVARVLRARVVGPDISLQAVASELSMQPRTLNRRLQAEGRSLRELVNEARFEVAQQLLGGTGMNITEIALALGYAESSSFTHAFQRWSGISPTEWRSVGPDP